MIALGIDPGLTGALGLICSQRGFLDCEDIPTCGNGTASGSMRRWLDADALHSLLQDWSQRFEFAAHSVLAVVERPIPMPTLPAQTIASQFDTFGAIRALLAGKTWGQGAMFPNPREWKAAFGLATAKADSRACCLRLYPSAPVKLVKHHNRAEALLIAHYGKGMAS